MPNRAAGRRAALLAGLATAWLLLACAPALAHATLVEASPARGGEVPEPPDRVELRFTEPVDAEFDDRGRGLVAGGFDAEDAHGREHSRVKTG